MSDNPFDELPEELKKIIFEIMSKIKDFDLSKLEEAFSELLSSTDVEKLTELLKNGKFNPFMMNLGNMQGLERFMQNMQSKSTNPTKDFVEVETPYYEIIEKNEKEGEIIFDLPGIVDLRHINWIKNQNTLELNAENEECKYQIDIILPENISLNGALAEIKNTVFILPFSKME